MNQKNGYATATIVDTAMLFYPLIMTMKVRTMTVLAVAVVGVLAVKSKNKSCATRSNK